MLTTLVSLVPGSEVVTESLMGEGVTITSHINSLGVYYYVFIKGNIGIIIISG